MDRLDELALLVAILDGGSLAAGARKTRRSAAAVTRALRNLERRMGVQLIERNTRRIAPTPAGRELAQHARRLIGYYADAIEDVASTAGTPRGSLRVSAPLEFGRKHVAPVITSFLEAHPQVSVELILSDQILDLLEHEIDVAIRISTLADSSLVAKQIGRVRPMVIASPEYLQRHGTPHAVSDLRRHECIVQTRGSGIIEWPFALERRKVTSIRPRGRFLVNSAQAVIEAACEGRGLAMPLSYQVAAEVATGRLVRVLEKFAPPPVSVNLVFTGARHITARARVFVDHAAAALRAIDQRHWL